jgi:hypothetical protein
VRLQSCLVTIIWLFVVSTIFHIKETYQYAIHLRYQCFACDPAAFPSSYSNWGKPSSHGRKNISTVFLLRWLVGNSLNFAMMQMNATCEITQVTLFWAIINCTRLSDLRISPFKGKRFRCFSKNVTQTDGFSFQWAENKLGELLCCAFEAQSPKTW